MHAITIADDVERTLTWERATPPVMGPGQVLIRTRATAVNRADLLQRRGRYPVPPGASQILGLEVAGVIEAMDVSVTGWSIGDRVCALLEGGGYAEQVSVDASMLLPIPERLSFVEAAAVPEVFYTAWLNVFLETKIQPDECVMVHAAASGVGSAAVQLCRAFGHRCFATASAGKLEAVRALGADVLIDRNNERFVNVVKEQTNSRGVDVILDPVGGSYFTDNLRSLAPGGRLVNMGLLGGIEGTVNLAQLMTRRLRIIGSVLRSRSRAEKVEITASVREHVWPRLESGQLNPVIHATFPITEAAAAHALLEANETIGKVVLTVGEAAAS